MSSPHAFTESLLKSVIADSHATPPHHFSPQQKWRNQVVRVIKKATDAERILRTGSWSHGTAIRGHSDVDHFVVLRGAHQLGPRHTLTNLHRAMAAALSRDVVISVEPPTVTIVDPFVAIQLEFVPAYRMPNKDYEIPDELARHWILSNPAAHISYIDKADSGRPGCRQLIRLIKAWKYGAGSKLSSLYLEMAAADYCLRHEQDDLLVELIGLLQRLVRLRLATIDDPSIEVSRPLDALSTESGSPQREMALLTSALEVAFRIEAATRSGASEQVAQYTARLFGQGSSAAVGGRGVRVPRASKDAVALRFRGLSRMQRGDDHG